MNKQDYNLFYLFNNDNNINTELVKFDTYFNLSIEEFNYNSDKKYLLSQFDDCDTYFIFNYLKYFLFNEEGLLFDNYSFDKTKILKRIRDEDEDEYAGVSSRKDARVSSPKRDEDARVSSQSEKPTPHTVSKNQEENFSEYTSLEKFNSNLKNVNFINNIINNIEKKLKLLNIEHNFDLDLLDTIKNILLENILQKKSPAQKRINFSAGGKKIGGENNFFSLNKIKLKCTNILEFFFVCDIIHDIHSIRDTSTSENSSDTQNYKDYDGIELLDINPKNIILDKHIKSYFIHKYSLNVIDIDNDKKEKIIYNIKKTPENICFEILQKLYEREPYFKFYCYDFKNALLGKRKRNDSNEEDFAKSSVLDKKAENKNKIQFEESQYNYTYVDTIGEFSNYINNSDNHINYRKKLKPSIGTIIDSARYYTISTLQTLGLELVYPNQERLKLELKLLNNEVIPNVKKIYNELDNYTITLEKTVKYNINTVKKIYDITDVNHFKNILSIMNRKTVNSDNGIIFTFKIKEIKDIKDIKKSVDIEIPKLGIKKLKEYIYHNYNKADKDDKDDKDDIDNIYKTIKETFQDDINHIQICNSILLMFKTLGDYSQ